MTRPTVARTGGSAGSAVLAAVLGAVLVAGLAGCGGAESDHTTQVVIATHDSWAAPRKLIQRFEKQSGYSVRIVPNGDAGEVTNKLVLTKDAPIADGVYGIDNTFASRAVDEGVLADYRSARLPTGPYDLPGDAAKKLTPVDWGDVCVNVDDAWFANHHLAEPRSLDDLVKPAYKDLFVTPGAATSSPGFAFLLATVGRYGEDGWQQYWTRLMANGAKLTSGWTDAYEVDYTAGGGHGERPIVLSYNTDPAYTIPKGGSRPTTSALLDTCYRQVEYAGVLRGARNPAGAKAFVDFLESTAFQDSLPDNMYVFPVSRRATLPAAWARWAKPADHPIEVDPAEIAAHRDDWLQTWGDLTTR
jgi:thiamine transport system substrate-binding protein